MLFGGVYVRDLREHLPRHGEYARREPDEIARIVIHHVGGGANRDYAATEIASWHVDGQGWPGIGYSFLVHPDGRLEYVGDLLTTRYHCGRLNATSLGVCLAGDFAVEPAEPSDRQLMRTRMLVGAIRRELGRELPIVGHRDLDPRATGYARPLCPGVDWHVWKGRVDGNHR